MRPSLYRSDALVIGGLILALILIVGGSVWYSNVHQCHGNGHYYWTTQCVSTGKSFVCYPVQQEEIVCDKP